MARRDVPLAQAKVFRGRALHEHKGRSDSPGLAPVFSEKLAFGTPPNYSSNNTLND